MNGRARSALALLLAAAAVLTAAFLWLDFRATTSSTRADSQLATFTGHPEGLPGMLPAGELRVCVPGDDALSAALRQQLIALLGSDPSFHGVTVVDSPPTEVGGPALLVEIAGRDGVWTPVRGQGHLIVKIAYASNGDLSWRDDSVVLMDLDGRPLRRIRGEFLVEDTTTGLLSQKGYDRFLGQYVAGEVGKSLSKAVQSPG